MATFTQQCVDENGFLIYKKFSEDSKYYLRNCKVKNLSIRRSQDQIGYLHWGNLFLPDKLSVLDDLLFREEYRPGQKTGKVLIIRCSIKKLTLKIILGICTILVMLGIFLAPNLGIVISVGLGSISLAFLLSFLPCLHYEGKEYTLVCRVPLKEYFSHWIENKILGCKNLQVSKSEPPIVRMLKEERNIVCAAMQRGITSTSSKGVQNPKKRFYSVYTKKVGFFEPIDEDLGTFDCSPQFKLPSITG